MLFIIILVVIIVCWSAVMSTRNRTSELKNKSNVLENEKKINQSSHETTKVPSTGSTKPHFNAENAHKFLETMNSDFQDKVKKRKNTLLRIIINNLKWLPKDVLFSEDVQRIILAFGQINTRVYDKHMTFEDVSTAALLFEELERIGVLKNNISLHDISNDRELCTLVSISIIAYKDCPEKLNLSLLTAIERHMNYKLGYRVSYIGTYPSDNPLNK